MSSPRYVRQAGPPLGEGTYGKVRKYVDTVTGRVVAVKKARLGNAGIQTSVYAEIKSLQELNHVNVVSLLDVVPLPNGKVMLVLEYCVTDLNRMLTHGLPEGECRKLPPTVVKSVLSSLLRALEHCHSNGIIHLDLKPPNVLFTSDGALKLCDFGMSVQWSGEPMALHSNVVTPWYRAPELLMNTRNHSPKVDMWAAACIFAELMVGAPLFDACNDLGIMKQICDKIGAPSVAVWPDYAKVNFPFGFKSATCQDFSKFIPSEYGPEAVDLFTKLLVYDADKRLSATEALRHPYFSVEPSPCSDSDIVACFPPLRAASQAKAGFAVSLRAVFGGGVVTDSPIRSRPESASATPPSVRSFATAAPLNFGSPFPMPLPQSLLSVASSSISPPATLLRDTHLLSATPASLVTPSSGRPGTFPSNRGKRLAFTLDE